MAEQFGKHVQDKPYLRSATNKLTMADVAGDQRPHYMSQVLTGAMFDIIISLSKHYVGKREPHGAAGVLGHDSAHAESWRSSRSICCRRST